MPSSRLLVATSAGSRPALSCSSMSDALLAREAAVVGARDLLAGQLVEPQREPLGQAAVVDEDQRRAVGAHQVEQLGVDRRPDRARRATRRRPARPGSSTGRRRPCRARACRRPGTIDLQVEPLRGPGVDDRDRPRRAPRRPGRPGSARSPPAGAGWPRGRCAAAAAVLGDQALEPLEAERQVRAALGAGDGVDLVDDHRADAAEDVPPARGQQQVEALGRGDQHVGRRAQHLLAVALAACRRCARPPRSRAPRCPRARRPRRCPPAARAGCAPRRS